MFVDTTERAGPFSGGIVMAFIKGPKHNAARVVLVVAIGILMAGCGGSSAKTAGTTFPSLDTVPPTLPDTTPATTSVPSGAVITIDGGSNVTAPLPTTPTPAPTGGCNNVNAITDTPVPCDDMGGKTVQHYTVGQAGTLYDPADNVPLARVTVSAPTFSKSDSSGDTPQYGYFASFKVTVTDIAPASTQDTVSPFGSFYVQEPNGAQFGSSATNSGNAYQACSSTPACENANATTELNPGQTVTGVDIEDVPSMHGAEYFDDGGQIDGYWTF
jgi:hypothetical protein